MKIGVSCYWRFKGEKVWHYGWTSSIDSTGLIRMGKYNGDLTHGPIVDPVDIEVRENFNVSAARPYVD